MAHQHGGRDPRGLRQYPAVLGIGGGLSLIFGLALRGGRKALNEDGDLRAQSGDLPAQLPDSGRCVVGLGPRKRGSHRLLDRIGDLVPRERSLRLLGERLAHSISHLLPRQRGLRFRTGLRSVLIAGSTLDCGVGFDSGHISRIRGRGGVFPGRGRANGDAVQPLLRHSVQQRPSAAQGLRRGVVPAARVSCDRHRSRCGCQGGDVSCDAYQGRLHDGHQLVQLAQLVSGSTVPVRVPGRVRHGQELLRVQERPGHAGELLGYGGVGIGVGVLHVREPPVEGLAQRGAGMQHRLMQHGQPAGGFVAVPVAVRVFSAVPTEQHVTLTLGMHTVTQTVFRVAVTRTADSRRSGANGRIPRNG